MGSLRATEVLLERDASLLKLAIQFSNPEKCPINSRESGILMIDGGRTWLNGGLSSTLTAKLCNSFLHPTAHPALFLLRYKLLASSGPCASSGPTQWLKSAQ